MTPGNLVRVKRDGGRGWHLIAREKYEAAPADYKTVDEFGRVESAEIAWADAGRQASDEASDGYTVIVDAKMGEALDAYAAIKANAEAESAAGAVSDAPSADIPSPVVAKPLAVGKGPRGLWFVKAGDAIVSRGFPTEEEADSAKAELVAGGAQ